MQKSRLVVSKDMAWDIAANHKPKQTLSEQQNIRRACPCLLIALAHLYTFQLQHFPLT